MSMGNTNKSTVLIVDDEVSNLDIMYEILKNNYIVKGLADPDIALKMLELQELPDLILLDVNMPKMSGYELCKIIKNNEKTKDIPIIFVTVNDNDKDELLGFAVGAADFITKPFEPLIAKARIKTHILLRQSQQELKNKIEALEKSLRIFENKVTRPSLVKASKTFPTEQYPIEEDNDFSKIFLDDHILDFEELEDIIDSRVNLMCLRTQLSANEMHDTGVSIFRYGEILTLYPDFITLGTGLKDLALNLKSIDINIPVANLKMALGCLETLSFTLLHWRKQLFSGTLKDPNAYDKSLLADIQTIINIFHAKTNDDIIDDTDDVEFF